MIRKKYSSILLLAALLAPIGAQAQSSFQEGTAAFRNAQYSEALEAFLQAEREGDRSPTLTYNTAVTYYKLGRYPEAASAFERLLTNPEWRDLARFHLALVAEKRGNHDAARDAYEALVESSQSEKLRKLADSRLAKLPAHEQIIETAPADRFTAVLNMSSGIDDNAFSLQDAIQLDSGAGQDSFNEYFAWAQYYLSGSAADGWRVHGFGYRRAYQDFESLDIDARSIGLSRHMQHGRWQSEMGVANIATDLDGDELTSQNKLLLRFQRPVGNGNWLSVSYAPSNHSGGDLFAHLDGWQHVAEAEWRFPGQTVSFDLGYRFESNDRDDLLTDNEFFSYSPTRHTVGAGLDWRLSSSWQISLAADYRSSDYDGINRLVDTDGVYKEAQRQADQTKLQIKALWQITPSLRLSGQLESTNNDENFDTYSYDKRETSFSIEYLL
jgi:tetratricopeptide (TPR) repeat protein